MLQTEILTLLYLFSTNRMKRNIKVITHHQYSCKKKVLVRGVDKSDSTTVSSNSCSFHRHPMRYGYFCSLFAFPDVLANVTYQRNIPVLKRCTFQMAYCIDNANLDRLNEMGKRQEKEQNHYKTFVEEVPEEHGITINSQFVQGKKEEELSKCTVYSEPPLNFNISSKTVKSSLKLIIQNMHIQSSLAQNFCHFVTVRTCLDDPKMSTTQRQWIPTLINQPNC